MSGDAGRWDEIEALFAEALELEPSERAAFLARRCGDDDALRREVEELLRTHDDAEARGFLEAAHTLGTRPADEASSISIGALRPGDRVGPFRIVDEIGRGGMGAVYLAERADGHFEQRVALKVIAGWGGPDHVERFQRERQIVASLEHPNIARLVDGGVSDEGVPYFAMEHVRGRPIDEHCRERDASVEQRLRLFVDVCAAVSHAHRSLVVHRDLKPSNIFVDDEGKVRLLDFGVAKLVPSAGESDDEATAAFMTPAYAAPELVRGQAVTTSVDVYALGAVLYRLLTGRAHHGADPKKTGELVEAILHRDPPRASSVLEGAASRRLRGDLDTILATALERDRARRYESVDALADDVRRHLDGRPIRARPRSVGYVVGKFVRRNRLAVVAASVAVLSLVGGLVAASWQAQVAERERRAAETAAREAVEVKDALVGVLEIADPNEVRGTSLSAEQLVALSTEKVRNELRGQPLVQAETLAALARMKSSLGRFDAADELAREALEIRRAHLGEEHHLVGASLSDLAHYATEAERYADAVALARRGLALQEAALDTPHRDVATTLHRLGVALTGEGENAEAQRQLLEALAMRRELFGDAHVEVARTLGRLSVVERALDLFDQAEEHARGALEIIRGIYGEEHTEVAERERELAMVFWDQGRFEDAEALLREVLAKYRDLVGAEHPSVADVQATLAAVLRQAGKLDEASRMATAVLELNRRLFGPRHASVAEALNRVALLRFELGDVRGASEALREAHDIWTESLGPTHPAVVVAKANLGAVLRHLGELDESEALLLEVLEYRNDELGPEHRKTATARFNMAMLRHAQGRLDEAEALHREVLDLRRRLFGDDHPTLTWSLTELGHLLVDRERWDEAETHYREALRISELSYAGVPPRMTQALVGVARCHLARDTSLDEARELAQQALDVRRESFGEDDWRTAEAEAVVVVVDARAGTLDGRARIEALLEALADEPRAPRSLVEELRRLRDAGEG